tara:strand:- start:59810 stop:60124 length:315 start_codon:yes stop_codon:yes gene_type:complete
MPDETFWGKALEQLPALAISLAAFMVIFLKGMRFFNALTVTFMRHQEKRDATFAATIAQGERECHVWTERREERMLAELELSRQQSEKTTLALGRAASLLERHS